MRDSDKTTPDAESKPRLTQRVVSRLARIAVRIAVSAAGVSVGLSGVASGHALRLGAPVRLLTDTLNNVAPGGTALGADRQLRTVVDDHGWKLLRARRSGSITTTRGPAAGTATALPTGGTVVVGDHRLYVLSRAGKTLRSFPHRGLQPSAVMALPHGGVIGCSALGGNGFFMPASADRISQLQLPRPAGYAWGGNFGQCAVAAAGSQTVMAWVADNSSTGASAVELARLSPSGVLTAPVQVLPAASQLGLNGGELNLGVSPSGWVGASWVTNPNSRHVKPSQFVIKMRWVSPQNTPGPVVTLGRGMFTTIDLAVMANNTAVTVANDQGALITSQVINTQAKIISRHVIARMRLARGGAVFLTGFAASGSKIITGWSTGYHTAGADYLDEFSHGAWTPPAVAYRCPQTCETNVDQVQINRRGDTSVLLFTSIPGRLLHLDAVFGS